MQMGINQTVYSHSSYFDVLEVFFDQLKEICGESVAKEVTVFADKSFNSENPHILYDDNDAYSERLKSCLEKYPHDYFLYQHEDMFLYKKPDEFLMSYYMRFLAHTDNAFIRLIRTGKPKLTKIEREDTLYKVHHDKDFFAVQPSLWKKSHMIKYLNEAPKHSVWDLEIKCEEINSKAGLVGAMHFNNEPARGGHFDSSVWPYVATAVVKGKWNTSEYPSELDLEKVRSSKRGQI